MNIDPKNQKDADRLYEILDCRMCDENIWCDGEASEQEARQTFKYYLKKATEIYQLGYLPSFDGDVFNKGTLPKSYDSN